MVNKAFPFDDLMNRLLLRRTHQSPTCDFYTTGEQATGSICVYTATNTFTNWSETKNGKPLGGTIIDFVMWYFDIDFSNACAKIKDLTNGAASDAQSIHREPPPKQPRKPKATAWSIHTRHDYERGKDTRHDEYIQARGVSLEIAEWYLSQISLNHGKWHALGIQNEAGGYELREPSHKLFLRSIGRKSITVLHPNREEENVYEGMFDFLSHRTICDKKYDWSQITILILNSISFLSSYDLSRHPIKRSFLDNDTAGLAATKQLVSIYPNLQPLIFNNSFKDLNEWIVSLNT